MPEGRLQRTRENYPEGVPVFGTDTVPTASSEPPQAPSHPTLSYEAFEKWRNGGLKGKPLVSPEPPQTGPGTAPATEPPAVPSTRQAAEDSWLAAVERVYFCLFCKDKIEADDNHWVWIGPTEMAHSLCVARSGYAESPAK